MQVVEDGASDAADQVGRVVGDAVRVHEQVAGDELETAQRDHAEPVPPPPGFPFQA